MQFGFRLCVAGERELAPVGGRDVHVDHLHGGELLQRAARGPGGYLAQLGLVFGGTFILVEILDAVRTALRENIKRRHVARQGHHN